MNKTEPNDAAYGHAAENGHCCGLTKRELFAAMALQGMLANPGGVGKFTLTEMVEGSTDWADHLIAALNTEAP